MTNPETNISTEQFRQAREQKLSAVGEDMTLRRLSVMSSQAVVLEQYLGQYLYNLESITPFEKKGKPEDFKELEGALKAMRAGSVTTRHPETNKPFREEMKFTGPQIASMYELVQSGRLPYIPESQFIMSTFVNRLVESYPIAEPMEQKGVIGGIKDKILQFGRSDYSKDTV